MRVSPLYETLNRIVSLLSILSIDLDILKILTEDEKHLNRKYIINIAGSDYAFEDVSIKYSPTPVNSPTTRGGVYFSDKFAYKVNGTIQDLSVVPNLSKMMLGPNTSFGEVKILTQIRKNETDINMTLTTNLINSVQTPDKIELYLILVNTKLD